MRESPALTLRLYVAVGTRNSDAAVANLAALCRARLPEQPHVEIVDVMREPKRALADGIFMTPTLVKLAPLPTRKVVGSLSNVECVLQALELAALSHEAG